MRHRGRKRRGKEVSVLIRACDARRAEDLRKKWRKIEKEKELTDVA